jgi:hypothetical protein
MPFMFAIDIRTIYQGINSLFLFKSFPFLLLRRSSLAHSFRTGLSFIPTMLFILWTAPSRFRRFLYIYYTWGNIVNHVFEDLRKTKAPQHLFMWSGSNPWSLFTELIELYIYIRLQQRFKKLNTKFGTED